MIYQKNYKKILLHDHLQKFKTTINSNESHCDISNRLNANLLIINFADLSFENCFEGLYFNKIQKEKFRNESLFTPSKDSKMSKVMSDLMTSTSIKNVFDDSLYVDTSQQIKNSQNLQNSQLNKDEKPLYNIVCENGSVNDNNYCASESYIGKEQHQLINKELQENMKE